MRNINEIVIHCTATPNDWRDGESMASKVAEVKRWHTDPKDKGGRGWSDIGYHYLIDRDGTVATGRPLDRIGAHVLGRNEGTIGISIFGGIDSAATDDFSDNYTPEQDLELRRLIAALKNRFPDIKTVSGHNQYAAKACPGFNAPRWYAGKPERGLTGSTTVQAVTATGGSVLGLGGAAVGALDGAAQIIAVVFIGVAILGLGWILRERIRKWAAGDR